MAGAIYNDVDANPRRYHGNQVLVLSAPHLVDFYCFAFYHVTCVIISKLVVTESS